MLKVPMWLIIDIRHKLERAGIDAYSLKSYFKENRAKCIIVAILLCALVLLAAVMVNLRPAKDHGSSVVLGKEWFYDLNTGKLFAVRAGTEPPVESPSGPLSDGSKAGVRAYVFRYEDEPNKSEMFVGFLETSMSKKFEWFSKSNSNQWDKTRLIKRAEDKQWYKADSKEGKVIREQLAKPDKYGRLALYCRPENE